MFLWIGLRLNEDYGNNVKQLCKDLNKNILVDEKAFHLPAHISLKISFEVEENKKEIIIDSILSIVRKYLPLKVKSTHIGVNNNIIWTLFEENKVLYTIHEELDEKLITYGINRHEFDRNFIFHSTLFMDDNVDRIDKMYKLIKDYDVEEESLIDTIIIGKSEDNVNYEVIINEKI